MIDTQKKTWCSETVEGIRKIFYWGNAKENKLIGDDLYLTDSERYDQIGPRTLNAFEFTKDIDYDYLVRANAGAYINQENLLKYLQDKPRNNFYSGIAGHYKGVDYASGSTYILSKDLVQRLCADKYLIRIYFDDKDLCVDDVAVGEMIARYGIRVHLSAMRISYVEDVVEMAKGNEPSNVSEEENYHYRFRSSDRRIDIERMFRLHEKIISNQKIQM
jgi:hypothetical protein